MTAIATSARAGAAAPGAVRARGIAILGALGLAADDDPGPLAAAIVPAAGGIAAAELERGLATLLRAVAERDPEAAACAGDSLVGLGPGRTPLGDDYLTGAGLAVAQLGAAAGFADLRRERWLASLVPHHLVRRTTPTAVRMITAAVRGEAPAPLAALVEPAIAPRQLVAAVAAVGALGATSGVGWVSVIGATALLLGRPGVDD